MVAIKLSTFMAVCATFALIASLQSPAAYAEQNTETGLASYYHRSLHGRPTASGEIFDRNEMVAAHPRLPFGTRVRVTNLENEREVTVRINDRGPTRKNRREGVVIDLSPAAAKKLDMIEAGRVRVRVDVRKPSRR